MSPLERRLLLALVSLIRDREPDPGEWPRVDVPLRDLYERCYRIEPDKSWELQRRNQRQALRRALGRLHPVYVAATALAWVDVGDEVIRRWQGGGSRESRDGFRSATPRWRLVSLTPEGIALAQAVERAEAAP